MIKQSILFEIGCEELPSQSVYLLGEALAQQTEKICQEMLISYDSIRFFSTPRRLAVYLTGVPEKLASQLVTRKGPSDKTGMTADGQPTPALLGFAKSCGVNVSELTLQSTDKGAWYVYENTIPGVSTIDILPELFKRVLTALPIAKPMYWGDQVGPFVRPVHWVVLLYGSQVVPATFFGIQAGSKTCGHRYHHSEAHEVESPENYEDLLNKLKVMPDFKLRRERVFALINEKASTMQAEPIINDALLDEITSIVEWPTVLMGEFSSSFLRVPQEVLIASMQTHQKCVALKKCNSYVNHASPMKDAEPTLLPYFLTICNIESQKTSQVILGNEKVMAARLSDADFFYVQDRKQKLDSFFPMLEQTLFQEKLGSLADQVRRVEQVVLKWGTQLGLEADKIKLAVRLSKCDLMSGMVGEFPELQGVIGYYYALEEGVPMDVALTIKEHYLPKFSQDSLPTTSLGTILSLAYSLDILVGTFGIGQKPTGVKDPYKLRRHALSVVRLLASCESPFMLSECLTQVAATFPAAVLTKLSIEELKAFILERIPAYYAAQNISRDLVASVSATQSEWLFDQARRLEALKIKRSELEPLTGGVKRVSHLLKSIDKRTLTNTIDPKLFELAQELTLYQAIQETSKVISPLYLKGDYLNILERLALLRPAIDEFFDSVMIMVDNEPLRMNRLKLLYLLQELLLGVADLSLLQV